MSVVEEPIANGVGHRGVAHVVVPGINWKLTGPDRGPQVVSVLHDFEQIAAFRVIGGREPPVVQLCGAPHKSMTGGSLRSATATASTCSRSWKIATATDLRSSRVNFP